MMGGPFQVIQKQWPQLCVALCSPQSWWSRRMVVESLTKMLGILSIKYLLLPLARAEKIGKDWKSPKNWVKWKDSPRGWTLLETSKVFHGFDAGFSFKIHDGLNPWSMASDAASLHCGAGTMYISRTIKMSRFWSGHVFEPWSFFFFFSACKWQLCFKSHNAIPLG